MHRVGARRPPRAPADISVRLRDPRRRPARLRGQGGRGCAVGCRRCTRGNGGSYAPCRCSRSRRQRPLRRDRRARRALVLASTPGEICGLIGPNGAGKTTLFNVLSRIYQPTSAAWCSSTASSSSTSARHEIARLGMARTFQNLALFPRHDAAGEHHGRCTHHGPRAASSARRSALGDLEGGAADDARRRYGILCEPRPRPRWPSGPRPRSPSGR